MAVQKVFFGYVIGLAMCKGDSVFVVVHLPPSALRIPCRKSARKCLSPSRDFEFIVAFEFVLLPVAVIALRFLFTACSFKLRGTSIPQENSYYNSELNWCHLGGFVQRSAEWALIETSKYAA